MRSLLIILAAVILAMAVGVYITDFSPSAVRKKNTEKLLQQFSDAVETQDRAQIAAMLGEVFTDDAKIHLEVTFSAINSANVRPMTQDFDKPAFLGFIDNVLFTLTDYHTRPSLVEFDLNEELANVQWKATQWADGPSYYQGVTVQMHFSGDTQCTGEAVFENKQPKLRAANCQVLLRSTTKGDSAGDTINKARGIHDLINQQR